MGEHHGNNCQSTPSEYLTRTRKNYGEIPTKKCHDAILKILKNANSLLKIWKKLHATQRDYTNVGRHVEIEIFDSEIEYTRLQKINIIWRNSYSTASNFYLVRISSLLLLLIMRINIAVR